MIFKPSMGAEIWIGNPSHVEVVTVANTLEQLDRIQQRAKELREAMGHAICATRRIACGVWKGGRTPARRRQRERQDDPARGR